MHISSLHTLLLRAVKGNTDTCWIDFHPKDKVLGSVWCKQCHENAINPTQWTEDDRKKLTDRMQKAWDDYKAASTLHS